MLRAIINNTEVNLPDRISFVFENPMLTEDRVPIPASLELELAPTPKNLAAFGHPERPTSKLTKKELPAMVLWEALPLFTGVASFNGFSGNIKTHFKSVEKGNLTLKLSELPLETVNVRSGTRYTSANDRLHASDPNYGWSANYNTLLNQAAFGQLKWVWAPVKTNYGEKVCENYIGYSDCTSSAGVVNAKIPAGTLGTRLLYSIVYPYPRLSHVVDKIFNGLLDINPFLRDEFKDLVIPTSFHKDFPTILGNPGLCNFILDNKVYPKDQAPVEMLYFNLASFMPDYASNDFIKDVLKMFGMILYPQGRGFTIKSLDDIIASTVAIDWSKKLIGEPEINIEEGKILDFEWNNVEEVEGTSERVANLMNVFDATQYDEDGVAQVEVTSTGEIYEVTKMVESSTSKNIYSLAQKRGCFSKESIESDKDVCSIAIAVKPANSVMEVRPKNDDPSIEYPHYKDYFWLVTTSPDDRKTRKYTPSITRYLGVKPSADPAAYHPQMSSKAFDPYGNRIAPFALEPYGPDGVMAKFYSKYKAWVEKDRKRLDGSFLLTAMDISTLDLSKKVHVNGVNYFIEKIEIEVASERILPARVSLVEA